MCFDGFGLFRYLESLRAFGKLCHPRQAYVFQLPNECPSMKL
jgi:hypothetical protein